jgi:hypothetical protein
LTVDVFIPDKSTRSLAHLTHFDIRFDCPRKSTAYFPTLLKPTPASFTLANGKFLITQNFDFFSPEIARAAIGRVVLGGWPFLTPARVISIRQTKSAIAQTRTTAFNNGIEIGECPVVVDLSFFGVRGCCANSFDLDESASVSTESHSSF